MAPADKMPSRRLMFMEEAVGRRAAAASPNEGIAVAEERK